jgi:ABC-type branched-subunit amino acid transport system substrate-binding protein
LNRARIRDALARISFDGITGKIEFDSLRGNVAAPILMTVKSGRWTREQ